MSWQYTGMTGPNGGRVFWNPETGEHVEERDYERLVSIPAPPQQFGCNGHVYLEEQERLHDSNNSQ